MEYEQAKTSRRPELPRDQLEHDLPDTKLLEAVNRIFVALKEMRDRSDDISADLEESLSVNINILDDIHSSLRAKTNKQSEKIDPNLLINSAKSLEKLSGNNDFWKLFDSVFPKKKLGDPRGNGGTWDKMELDAYIKLFMIHALKNFKPGSRSN